MLGLIRQTFPTRNIVQQMKLLYINLVLSQVLYCSVFVATIFTQRHWVTSMVQKLATKYLLSDFQSNYKSRLLALNLFLLMHILKLLDFMFEMACLKSPHENFNILNFPKFRNYTSRSSSMSNLPTSRYTPEDLDNFTLTTYQDSGTLFLQLFRNLF